MVRASLARQEDTMIFALIERAKFPLNSLTYSRLFLSECFTLICKTNKEIWKMYFHELILMFINVGDDGKYAQTALADLSSFAGACLYIQVGGHQGCA
ncbi:chorismate mutase 2-like [Vigna umbellata]|uniref:chorismate mutase 2-like n=1 Tax=Vigna umbellata TaxID=87088 RepID=UPI001F5FAB83|nr:chorismate mutase 2-like [Vigna umbellata]